MARPGKKKNLQPQSVWGDEHIVANTDAPAYKAEINGLKWKRRALYTIAFGAIPVMAFMGMAMFANASAVAESSGTTSSRTVNSSGGKSEAWRAMQAWLGSNPAPIPGAEIVSWDGFETEVPPPPAEGSGAAPATYVLETHDFTVQRGDTMWVASVQVAVDNVLGATAMASPALTPIVKVNVAASSPWFGLTSGSATPAVTQAIQTWAAAYTSGDADTLQQIVQDRDTSRSYVPLKGVEELVSVTPGVAGSPTVDGVPDPSTLIIRVDMKLWWEGGKPEVAPNESQPDPTPISYDLLIHFADTATPVVVAWGAPGSGDNLTAYQNAVPIVLGATPGEGDEPGTGTGEDVSPETDADIDDELGITDGVEE